MYAALTSLLCHYAAFCILVIYLILLGLCYRDGVGVPRNASEAVKWFRLAADQDDTDAQYQLGTRYVLGDGCKQVRNMYHITLAIMNR